MYLTFFYYTFIFLFVLFFEIEGMFQVTLALCLCCTYYFWNNSLFSQSISCCSDLHFYIVCLLQILLLVKVISICVQIQE